MAPALNTRLCPYCQQDRPIGWFTPHRQKCIECKRAWRRAYRRANRERRRQKWFNATAPRDLAFRKWLAEAVYRARSRCRHDGRICDLTLDNVMNLLRSQKYRCAVTGLELTHRYHCLKSASLDRKDNRRGYEKGNIQIVCKFINHAKNNHTDEEIAAVLAELILRHRSILQTSNELK